MEGTLRVEEKLLVYKKKNITTRYTKLAISMEKNPRASLLFRLFVGMKLAGADSIFLLVSRRDTLIALTTHDHESANHIKFQH